jgi:thiol-disulfide isomerase/thioredoxin
VVLLDFWTYCCINCMHVIPDLKKLEAKYANELVVIGVHSAKFTNEGESENIRQAILRYEIEHPVVNDREFRIWRQYGARAWPTLVLIDPEGYVVGGVSGEGHYDLLDRVIGEVVHNFRAQGKFREEPLTFALEREHLTPHTLSFPGKVLADPATDRLFIADSNHNRIVISRSDGQVLDIAGKGDLGADDGPFASAAFNHPQGMAVEGKYLYVADTENHLLRRLDLEAHTVETLAGTGKQALGTYRRGPARETALSSPWDLTLIKGILYIAMAGSHQVWAMNLQHEEIGPYAGSSREARVDGPLMEAALAQPSGITSDGTNLYVADSEVSSIRAVSLNPQGRVSTVVGLDLFEFGDADGQGETVRLQHPLGVVYHHGVLFVADTYNHKIKEIGPGLRTSVTFLGNGQPGHVDGEFAQFYEPGGLSLGQGKMYIADTNNHAIRVADLHTKQVTTLLLRGVGTGPEPSLRDSQEVEEFLPNTETIHLAPQKLRTSANGTLVLDIRIPAPYKLNPDSPLEYRMDLLAGEALSFASQGERVTLKDAQFPLRLPVDTAAQAGKAEVQIQLSFFYCREGEEGICALQSLCWRVPVEVSVDGGREEIRIDYQVNPEVGNFVQKLS